jgi:MOSC domain-containing protein YiiM
VAVDGITPETCAECGFDARAWTRRDAGSLLDALGTWWSLATTGIPAAELNHRPAPGVWSALEYGLHSARVTAVIRDGIERILAEDGCQLPVPPAPADADGAAGLDLDPAQVLSALGHAGSRLAALIPGRATAPARWDRTGRLGPVTIQAQAALVHAVHDASHHFMDVSRGLTALGAGAPAATGRVAQVNSSGGGVPKTPVPGGRIGWRGLEGDRQRNRKHHGRPYQALCLWSSEVIAGLAAAGHALAPGRAGENLTVAGLDWATLRAGTALRVGSALIEISWPAIPCHHQTQWFTDGDFSRISHEDNPGSARWYAWVRRPGAVEVGDEVEVLGRLD